MRNKKVTLTERDRQQISTKFFELFVEQGKISFPKSTYHLTRLSKKFGVNREKLALFVIQIEDARLQKEIKENKEKTDHFKKFFKIK